jgi:hypothetical protein
MSKELRIETTAPELPVERIVAEKWFCLVGKASVYQDYQEKDVDVFINFGWSERIEDARSELACGHNHEHDHHCGHHHPSTGRRVEGHHHCQIPYLLDRSFKSLRMKIFDFAVGRKTVRWARQQADFHTMVVKSAIEAIQETFGDQIRSDSLTLLTETDYKAPPDSITERISSQAVERPPSLLPQWSSKINSICGSSPVPQKRTKLTETQRSMLFHRLNVSTTSSSLFVEQAISPTTHDTLKVTIPSTTFYQNERFITVKICLPKVGIEISSILWEVSISPPKEDFIGTSNSAYSDLDETRTEERHTPLDQRLDVTFLDLKLTSYALHIALYGLVDTNSCYATISDASLIIVLRKMPQSEPWKSPFKLSGLKLFNKDVSAQ